MANLLNLAQELKKAQKKKHEIEQLEKRRSDQLDPLQVAKIAKKPEWELFIMQLTQELDSQGQSCKNLTGISRAWHAPVNAKASHSEASKQCAVQAKHAIEIPVNLSADVLKEEVRMLTDELSQLKIEHGQLERELYSSMQRETRRAKETDGLKEVNVCLEAQVKDLRHQLLKAQKHEGHLSTALDKVNRQLPVAEQKAQEEIRLNRQLEAALVKQVQMEAQLKSSAKQSAVLERSCRQMQKTVERCDAQKKDADRDVLKKEEEATKLRTVLQGERKKADLLEAANEKLNKKLEKIEYENIDSKIDFEERLKQERRFAASLAAQCMKDGNYLQALLEALEPDLRCPISIALPQKPVVAADGFTYEFESISKWIDQSGVYGEGAKSPMTNLPLSDTVLVDNIALRHVIEKFNKFRDELAHIESRSKDQS